MMSKKLKTTLTLLAIVFVSSDAFALPDANTINDVRYTVHNLSSNADMSKGMTGAGRNYVASDPGADQVCVFCHTPHNASPSIPLWNKVYPAGLESSYRLYTSSVTLTNTTKQSSITANSESLLCLSCHDGKTAINVLHNSSYRDSSTLDGDAIVYIDSMSFSETLALGDQFSATFGSINRPNLGAIRSDDGLIHSIEASKNGTNLTDDHPIGFSYTAAQAEDSAGLKPVPDAGIRLFGPTKRVECSSCHNPHVYYGSGLQGSTRKYYDQLGTPLVATAAQKEKTPFLNISNTGSNMCKGCHIK